MIIDLCDLPDTCGFGQKHEGIIHGLAPREVYRNSSYYYDAGGLLHRLFTLTLAGGFVSVILSLEGIFLAVFSLRPILTNLEVGTLPYGVRTFLIRPKPNAIIR